MDTENAGYIRYYPTLSFVFGVLALAFSIVPIIPIAIAGITDIWLLYWVLPIIVSIFAIFFGYYSRKLTKNKIDTYIGLIGGLISLIIFPISTVLLLSGTS